MAERGHLVDPRGRPPRDRIDSAARLADLSGSTILLVDNGKLEPSYGPYAEIRDTLRSAIHAEWTDVSFDLLAYTHSDIKPLADGITDGRKIDAVVLALADAGVSVQTALLAVEMERRGIPTVTIATRLGSALTRSIYDASATGPLPLVVIDTVRTDSAQAVRAMIESEISAVTAGLRKPIASVETNEAGLFDGGSAEATWSAAAAAVGDFQDWAESKGIGDGLPLLPPTEHRVEQLLSALDEEPETIIYDSALTSGRSLRIVDAAANAAMTGCPPAAFPVVVAALRAMAHPDYRLSQAAITTHPSGNAIVFSGGDPKDYGMSSGPGCLGPGARGNACVGRAVSMTVQNLFGARPGQADLTMFGSPAEFTYCLAESIEETPWPSLASEFGDGSPGVFVLKAESPRNVLEHLALAPEELARSLAGAATSLCSNNSYIPSDLLVLVNPEHAAIFGNAGWTRADLALAIYNLARMPRAALQGRGIRPIRPRYMDALEFLPVTRSPKDVRIVVAGAHGPQSMVALPWGYSRGQWHAIGPLSGGASP